MSDPTGYREYTEICVEKYVGKQTKAVCNEKDKKTLKKGQKGWNGNH